MATPCSDTTAGDSPLTPVKSTEAPDPVCKRSKPAPWADASGEQAKSKAAIDTNRQINLKLRFMEYAPKVHCQVTNECKLASSPGLRKEIAGKLKTHPNRAADYAD